MTLRPRLSPIVCSALVLAAACNDSTTGPSGGLTSRGVVVLNGFGQQGVTLLPDTGTASARIDFGGLFDGGGFALANDTLVSTSSRGGGDLLYVADLRGGSVLKLQMPTNSNPGGAAFAPSSLGARIVVALRDSGAIALVTPRTGGADVSIVRNAGACPYDVFTHGGAVWSVDANLACGTTYAPFGASRLVRIVPGDARRDTIALGPVAQNATSAVVVGDVAYVGAAGYVDYSAQPFRLVSGGAVIKVDLRDRRVVQSYTMPAGSTGAGVRLGGDGRLYVSYYSDITSFASRIIALDPQTMTPVGPRAAGAPYLDFRTAAGASVPCEAATADAAGRLFCITNGAASAATLHVFGSDGREVRSVPAGQGAVDLALR